MATTFGIDGETAKKISLDVANGVTPQESLNVYGSKELAFYAQVKREYEERLKTHPNAGLDVRE